MRQRVRQLSKLLLTSTFRWLAAYLLVFIAASAIVVGYLFWHTNDLLTRQLVQTLAAEVTGLREQFQSGGLPVLAATIQQRSDSTTGALYLLTGSDGRRAAGNLEAVPSELKTSPAGALFAYRRGSDSSRLAAGVAIDVSSKDGIARAILVVARDVQEQREFAETVRQALVWGLGLIAIFGLGGGLLASVGLLRRVDAVTATSRTIMAGDLSRRIAITGSGDEFDRLAISLNDMLDRIEQLMAGMREVSDNIAHDLKTPLSRMRNRLEGVLRDSDNPVALRGAIERAIDDSDDLVRTFNAMLNIARLESGAAREPAAPVDLGQVIRDAAEFYEPVAEEAGFALSVETVDRLMVDGDRQLIGQAVANLIDNAIKYGTAASRPTERQIALSAHRQERDVYLIVADRGPGIPPADRERALERFGRLDAARTQPGSGLGLSLVTAVARLHGGSVRLEDNAPGLRVVVVLPAL
jgi:signal transduction histidine kinase